MPETTRPVHYKDGRNYSGYTYGEGVTGVKGNAEANFRTGSVNLTPSNIGYFNGSIAPMGGCLPASDGDSDKVLHGDGSWSKIVSVGVGWEENGILGAKNLLENTATTTTDNGITFTVHGDGSISTEGTAGTDGANLEIVADHNIKKLAGKDVILSGSIGGTGTTYYLYYEIFDHSHNVVIDGASLDGDTVIYIPPIAEYIYIYIVVHPNQNMDNKVFYPMLRLASDTDDTFIPYAMTNRELTETIGETDISSVGSTVTGAISNLNNRLAWSQTEVVIGHGSGSSNYIEIPSNCTEILLQLSLPNDYVLMTQYIVQSIRTEDKRVQFGGGGNSTQGGVVGRIWLTTTNRAYIDSVTSIGASTVDKTSATYLRAFYR